MNRNGVFDHAIDCGDGPVIRFVPASGGGRAEVRRARLLDFAAGSERVEVVNYPSLVNPPEMVVARAFSRLGEGAAGTMFGGPEHFATWCVNGQAPVRPLAGPSPASPPPPPALLKDRGLWERRRHRKRHRRRRERRSCFGSMVQMDGSHHEWFERRGSKCVLMALTDDGTNTTLARCYEAETTEAAFDLFERWAGRYGLPRSVYADRHGIYRDEEHPEKPTQFGRAMKDLGVELILAHSPQAKGRVERRHAVFQDRLVKEMRLRNISDMAQANDFLESKFLDDLNGHYAVKAAKAEDLHRGVEPGLELGETLCVQEQRAVGQDWCVRWRNRWLQIGAEHGQLCLAGKRVLVKQLRDGKLIVESKGQRLSCKELSARPEAPRMRKAIVNNRRWIPPVDHPWKNGPAIGPIPRVSLAPAAPARDLHAGGRRKAG